MNTMKLHIYPVLIAFLIGMTSCVYPFDIDAEGEGGSMVIEGDILIGELTTVRLSHTMPISTLSIQETFLDAEVCVMDDRGDVYPTISKGEDGFVVDTRNADPDRQYKLHVKNLETGRTYESTFQAVSKPAVIDSLSYILDEERDRMDIAISMHSGSESYFKWSYTEDWEYRTILKAAYKYIPPTVHMNGWWAEVPDGPGQVVKMDTDDITYYCWSHYDSKNIMVFSTESQSDDRFVDLEFHTIDRTDRRISYIYHIAVELEALTKDAYTYWQNVKNNSEYNGSLFAPNPSELLGNISCLEDPSEFVYGYISAAQRSVKTLYVRASSFYKEKETFDTATYSLSQSDWYQYYKDGYLPFDVSSENPLGPPDWVKSRCVDCRQFGGTTTKPDFWAY